jgi:hypothetical protein
MPEPSDPPIACRLRAGEYLDRTHQLAALAARALRGRERIAGGERLTFAHTREIERELQAMIAAESSCCAFLQMQLGRNGQGLMLEITGPEGTEPIIAELFA